MNLFNTLDLEIKYQNKLYYVIGAVSNLNAEPPTILCVWQFRDENDNKGWEMKMTEYERLIPVFEQHLQDKYELLQETRDAGEYS